MLRHLLVRPVEQAGLDHGRVGVIQDFVREDARQRREDRNMWRDAKAAADKAAYEESQGMADIYIVPGTEGFSSLASLCRMEIGPVFGKGKLG